MAITNIGKRFVARAAEIARDYQDSLEQGHVADFAEYRYFVGYLAAIKQMIRIFEEVEKE